MKRRVYTWIQIDAAGNITLIFGFTKEDLSPEELAVIGRFAHYIEQKHLVADEPFA